MAIRIIGAAIGHGAQDPASQEGPDAARAWGLARRLEELGGEDSPERFLEVSWDTTLYPHFTRRYRKDVPVVAEFSERLRKVAGRVVSEGDFPLVVGGDHSCAIGTWSGVAAALRERGQGELGLVWVDAHLDSHTFETTQSWAIHGMPLACLLGHGQRELAGCAGFAPKVAGSRCAVFGARSWEAGERELLEHEGVRIFGMEEIGDRGALACLEEAARIARGGGGHWGMSLDLDAFDPADAPGVGTPERGGLRAREFREALRALRIGADPMLRALEIAEYAPRADREGKTLELLGDLASALFD